MSLPASSGSEFETEVAVVEVGREGHEALGGEAVADLLDVGHEAPPLLDHDQAGTAARHRGGQVATGFVAVARERDEFTHAQTLPARPPPVPARAPTRPSGSRRQVMPDDVSRRWRWASTVSAHGF